MTIEQMLAEIGRLYLENVTLRAAVDELNAQAERWHAEQAHAQHEPHAAGVLHDMVVAASPLGEEGPAGAAADIEQGPSSPEGAPVHRGRRKGT